MALPFRDINLQVSSDSYTFTSPSSPNAPALTLDRPTGDIRLSDGALLAGKRVSRVSSIAGILGIIQLRLDKYVIVITKAQPIGRLKGHMVFKIAAVDFLPMRERQVRDPDEDRLLLLLKTFLKSGSMYFAYSIDLTNSFQRQAYHDNSTPLWKRADDRFFWNRFVQSDLINFRNRGARANPGPQPSADPYLLPVIFGMLEIHPTNFKGTPLTIALITRRSRHRGGTRYFSRGIDEQGHVSNYNETEQVVILNDSGSGMSGFAGSTDMQSGKPRGHEGREMQILSYVQTRGSIPVYWAEINNLHYVPTLQIRGIDVAFPAAAAHFSEQIRLYGDNFLVNLVNQKGRERRMKEAYEQIVDKLVTAPRDKTQGDQVTDEKFHTIESNSSKTPFDRLHYVYFDYHSETKGMQMHRAQLLIDKLEGDLVKQQYFRAVDMPASIDGRLEVRNYQTSVVRTNCMDCLDRTNVVQSLLARWTLDRMFADLGLMQPGTTFKVEDPTFEFLFRNLWADNADVVSKSYSGTGAMKTDVTRLGKRTKAGALADGQIAVTRWFRNNFLDGPRQDAFDLFLGTYLPGASSIGASFIFADRRPILIQAIPYILAFSVFLVFVGLFTRRLPDSAVLPMRLFILFWTLVGAWCLSFVYSNGMLYVNWPKLNPRPWATEGYQETIGKVRKDPVIGSLVARHERGLSTARYLNAEEGKKRIE